MEPIILPILNFAFTETGCDFVNEALDILNIVLYKRKSGLTPNLWFYYPLLCYIVIGIPKEVNVREYPNLTEE